MLLTRIVYEFVQGIVDAAPADAALADSIVHFHTKQEMNQKAGTKFIRISGLKTAKPMPLGDAVTWQRFNAIIDVSFIQIPEDQTVERQFEAMETVGAMVIEFLKAVWADMTLGTSDCSIVRQVEWEEAGEVIKPANLNFPLSAVRLRINPDRNI